MSDTNVPALTIIATGVVAPTEQEILAGRWADYQAAFGGALNESLSTAQGQLVMSDTAVIGATNDLFAYIVNQVDPANADGIMQDALGRIYYQTRIPESYTTVDCTCTGATGVTVDAGALAQATDGTIYQALSSFTFPTGGSVTVTFQALTGGPVSCPAGTLAKIYRVVNGWDTITNPSDGTLGRAVESRAEFETRRQATVAANSSGMLASVRGAVTNVSGVVDCFVYENDTSSPLSYGGVTIAANSIYVGVYGGADADVASAIFSKKMPGCGYTGSTSVTVTDTTNGLVLPYPTYTVKFQRATATPIYYAVSIVNNGDVPSDAVTQIKNAIVSAFSGRIGGTVFALASAPAVVSLGTWAQLISIYVGTSASPTATEQAINIDQYPTVSADNIAVTLV